MLPTRPVLHKLKVISFGKTWYKPGSKDRAVDVKARNLHDEYVVKARKVAALWRASCSHSIGSRA